MGQGCQGYGDYDEVRPGDVVTITDADQDIVGTATLQPGHIRLIRRSGFFCVFPFATHLTKRSNAYQVSIGTYGKLTIPPTDIDHIAITVG